MEKKTYIPPLLEVEEIITDGHILAGSTLSPDGGGNIEILPGEGEFGGEFNTRPKGWSCENWTEE